MKMLRPRQPVNKLGLYWNSVNNNGKVPGIPLMDLSGSPGVFLHILKGAVGDVPVQYYRQVR